MVRAVGAVASPWFRIGPARRLYSQPLANALSFYRDQRDGPDFIRSPLRMAPGDLNSARAMTYRTPPVNGDGNFKGSLAKYATGVRINASGGWFDAGDNLHFVETASFTVAALLQGIVSFPGQLGRPGQVNFTGEAKFGLDFLQRMWNERTRTLYYQVGTGEANNGALSDTLNLYDVSALADYELDLAIAKQHVSGLAITQAGLLANVRAQLEKAIGTAASDPFGFGLGWDQWDTTAHGTGLSVMANSYDALVRRPVFARWAQRWLDDILGANAWGVSLIVGDGSVFPDCLQHQIANLVGSHDGTPPVLAGATVEGPNSFAATGTVQNMRPCVANGPGNVPYSAFRGHHAVFADNVQSYSTAEPAIDLTALTPLAFAW
jgi:hypothetical protein